MLLHLESFGNPRKFARLARRVARTKPIVAVKSGRHVDVAPGAGRHAVPVAEQSVAALFASAGVIRVETVAQMFDVGTLLAHQPLPAGPRVAIVGNSTAIGVLVADAVLEEGLELAAGPPVDIGAAARPRSCRRVACHARRRVGRRRAWTRSSRCSCPPLDVRVAEFGRALREASPGSAKPVVASFLSTEGVPAELAVLDEDGMPGRGLGAQLLDARSGRSSRWPGSAEYARWRRRPVGESSEPPGVDAEQARRLVGAGAGRERTEPAAS